MNKYKTVSIPKPLADDIIRYMDEIGYWPSLGSFVREACQEKLDAECMKQKAMKEAEG